jgi:hypothetical protein
VAPPTPTLVVIASSLAPASAASRICARFSRRTACLPPLSKAVSMTAVGSVALLPDFTVIALQQSHLGQSRRSGDNSIEWLTRALGDVEQRMFAVGQVQHP